MDKDRYGLGGTEVAASDYERGLDSVKGQRGRGRFYTDGRSAELVRRAAFYYDEMGELRKKLQRANNYFMGRQLDDEVMVNGRKIRVADLLKQRGLPEFQNDILSDKVLTMKGILRQESMAATVRSTDSDEDMYAALFSELLRNNDNLNDRQEQNAQQFEKFCVYGLLAWKVNWMLHEGKEDVVLTQPDIFKMAFPVYERQDLEDVEFIAEAHDMSWADLVETFAPRDDDGYDNDGGGGDMESAEKELRNIYARQGDRQQARNKTGFNNVKESDDFYHSSTIGKYRVIEIWTKERTRSLWVHDYANGLCGFVPMSEKAALDAENARRMADNVRKDVNGMPVLDEDGNETLYVPEEEVKLVKYKAKVERFWYYWFVSPTGYVLKEGMSPYVVKRDGYSYRFHPYTFLSYPALGGEVRSFVMRGIDKQRAYNHYMLMLDSILGNSAKGALAYDDASQSASMSFEEVVRNYNKPNGVVRYDSRKGNAPTPLQSTPIPNGLQWLIQENGTMVTQQTGVQGALQGVHRNTSGKQYEMERNAASTTVADYFGAFYSFCLRTSKKQLWLIQGNYDSGRSVRITGDDFREYYNPETMGDVNADLQLDMDAYSAIQRASNNDMLWQLMMQDKIDVETMLDCGMWTNTARLKRRIQDYQAEKQQLAAAQQAQMAASQGGVQGGGAVPLQTGQARGKDQASPMQPTVGTTGASA